ncbi:MAG: hypothetical protein ACLQPH_10215 [Acidimicrobiales bacterium]
MSVPSEPATTPTTGAYPLPGSVSWPSMYGFRQVAAVGVPGVTPA